MASYPLNNNPRHKNSRSVGSIPTSVLVDGEDRAMLAKFNNWFIDKRGDVVSKYQTTVDGKKKMRVYKMHRIIMGVTSPKITIDHINRNRLDNRKSNLRICTQSENSKNLSLKKNNTSGFAGVDWDKARGKWKSRIKVNYKGVHIGRYDSIEEAISARLFAEDYYFGKFAPNTRSS